MVTVVTSVSEDLLAAINSLIHQVSTTAPSLSREELEALVAQDALSLLVATDDESGQVQGMLSLVCFDIPTGRRAWIEDVVVDEAARHEGVGARLVQAAVARAQELGAKSIDLTSRPSREAANRLYRREGFKERETNIYRYAGK